LLTSPARFAPEAQANLEFMKRQYQPKKMRRKRQHGFLARKSTRGGRATLRNRRRQGRKRLTPV
jgi:large subunit ribosomal protein L34